MANVKGNLRKMRTEHSDSVQYFLPLVSESGEREEILMNDAIGALVQFEHTGKIHCIACGRVSKKSFQQGYCFPCMRALPECDSCIVRPETCHFHEGTCRDAEWALKHCMQDHYLYLANTSGLKVGITRGSQVPTRWMDQGATQALPIARAKDRLTVGKLEVALKANVSDRTQWQRMLKGDAEPLDLPAEAVRLMEDANTDGIEGWEPLSRETGEETLDFRYPVNTWPEKVKSLNFDKTPVIEGILQGIKGQYLLLDSGVLNIRKFGGYQVIVTLG